MAYAIRIRYSSTAQRKSEEFEGFHANHKEVLSEQSFDLGYREPSIDREPPHYFALIRLDESEDIEAVLSELSESVFAGVKWYVIHACHCGHDGSRDNCEAWGAPVRERGNVPDVYR
jgi:hypothetical protein